MTVGDLITRAMQRVNLLQPGVAPSADEMADAISVLNTWVDALALERFTIPFQARTTWTITSTEGTLANPYTVGSGGDVNIARPPLPNEITIRYQDTSTSPTTEYPLTPLTDAAWRAIPQKNLTATLPTAYYYNPTYASGLGSLYLWPVPSSATLQGVCYAPSALAQFSLSTDTITVPAGYLWFMQENLAVLLGQTYRENLPVDPGLLQSARESKERVKASNLRLIDLGIDAALTHGAPAYDINAGP